MQSLSKRIFGFSLIEVVVSVGILAIIMLAASSLFKSGLTSVGSIGKKMDLAEMQTLIRQRLNCQTSLGNPALSSLPLLCSNYSNVPLKNKNGTLLTSSSGKIGEWQITARCLNNELVVGAVKPGKDPLTGALWSTHPVANDLFQGLSEFCHHYFYASPSSCSAPYNYFLGYNSNGKRCCRYQTTTAATIASGSCQADEYLLKGGGFCTNDSGWGGLGYMFINGQSYYDSGTNTDVYLGKDSWMVGCGGLDGWWSQLVAKNPHDVTLEMVCCQKM